ncbi:Uu.00g020080.m01.CDS01 [Anthostomella pinea]|uniref:Uu.00g020080.m01.CDS01 n=1 Tax=Anthostomella pinea TaxID=933095 RepID=A0AAI8W019_9PEZI|nr:Uu.00g020080.m01.CDS01 [Anthostomella pinea]
MPTYLCHGFRWHRKSICYFIVIQNLEDGAPEWVVAPRSQQAILDAFAELFDFLPSQPPPPPQPNDSSYHSRDDSYENRGEEERRERNGGEDKKPKSRSAPRKRSISSLRRPKTSARDDTPPPPVPPLPPPPLLSPLPLPDDSNAFSADYSPVKLLEEFDPTDETSVSRPWAYVADHVIRVDTSVSIADEISRYENQTKTEQDRPMSGPSDESGRKLTGSGNKKAGWLEKLRDQLQRGELIRWYVVVCGDELRENPPPDEEDDEEEDIEEEQDEYEQSSTRSQERRRYRQSQSTQSTGPSVIENGFEFRLPEFAGLAERPPTVKLERRRARTLPAPLAMTPQEDIVPPPPQPAQDAGKLSGTDNFLRPKTPKSGGGLRRLFSRRSTEGSN